MKKLTDAQQYALDCIGHRGGISAARLGSFGVRINTVNSLDALGLITRSSVSNGEWFDLRDKGFVALATGECPALQHEAPK